MKTKSGRPEIIYYDIDRLDRISYYIAGFQLNQHQFNYTFRVKRKLPAFLKSEPFTGKWQYFLFAVGLFRYRSADTDFYFAIDRSDHSTNKMNEGYLLPLLEKVSFYFKVNYNPEFVATDPEVSRYREKIIPLSPSFPIRVPRIWPFLPFALPIGADRKGIRRPRERMNHLTQIPSLDMFRNWRKVEPDLDVFFILYYYGKSHHSPMVEYRNRIMMELAKHTHLKTVIGFVCNGEMPPEFEALRQQPFGMMEYLEQVARSKVAIYVRGPHDGISSKFCQLLSMGKPIVGQTIANNREILYRNRFFDQQFAYDDPKALVDRIVELLKQPDELAALAQSNAETFDRHLTPEAAISGLLSVIQDKSYP